MPLSESDRDLAHRLASQGAEVHREFMGRMSELSKEEAHQMRVWWREAVKAIDEARVEGVRAAILSGGKEFEAGPDAHFVYGPCAIEPGKVRVTRYQVLSRNESGEVTAFGPVGHHAFAEMEEAVRFMALELNLDGTLVPGRTQQWMMTAAWDRGVEMHKEQLRMRRLAAGVSEQVIDGPVEAPREVRSRGRRSR